MALARHVAIAAFLSFAAAAFAATASAQVAGSIVVQGPNGQPVVVQAPRDTRPPTGTARVRGRITSDTGQPLRHISVQLGGAPGPHFAITDNDGRYEFSDLPAGRFTISANHTGYVAARSDEVQVADGQRIDNVDLRLPHGGVIAGQIVDEFGEPVIGATVSPMRQQFQNGQRRLLNGGSVTTTNDLGEYRLFGLPPGRYFVTVTPRNEQFSMLTGPPNGPATVVREGVGVGYAPTYFPGTPDAAAAQAVTVAAAQTVNNVSFALVPTRLARITGVAYDTDGKVVTRATAMLMPRNNVAVGGVQIPGGPIGADGTFTINNVPPGSYYVRVTIPPAGPPAPPAPGALPRQPQFAIASVTVNGEDVSGLVLTPVRPALLRGRVVFDDPGAAAPVQPASMRVLAQRADPFGPPLTTGPPANVVVNDDFSFELSASPERTNIRVTIGAPAPGVPAPPVAMSPQSMPWRVKAVRVRGFDVTDSGIDLKDGETLDEVEVEMTRTAQTLTGTVTGGDGAPASRAMVVVFPQNRDLWSTASGRYNGRATTDPNGQFRIASLPPGAYYAVAASQPGPGLPTDWNDPDVLEAAIQSAKSFSLAEGGTTTVDLRISR
jgi:protocatechuate 3,4-dioxygenase beta subunit